jgi:peptidoglycan/LPS O-acetylase OafA/YrhL
METPRNEELANLDFLRAMAVLCVFAGHVYLNVLHGKNTTLAWHFAQMGVLSFFVHTSLVLMQSLDRMKVRGWSMLRTFYVRRWFRIYPLSMICVTFAFFHLVPFREGAQRLWTLGEYVSNLSLTQNLFYRDNMLDVLWTLPLEVQMYVLLPILYILLKYRSPWWSAALWIVSIPTALIQRQMTGRLDIFEYVPCFLGGVIAWRLMQRHRPILSGWLWPLTLLAASQIWFLAEHEKDMPYRWAFCLALGLAIPWFREMRWQWMTIPSKYVARYSYGIYLSHTAAIWTAFRDLGTPSNAMKWAVFVLLAFGLPLVMYYAIEKPLIDVGKRITTPRNVRAARSLEIVGEPINRERGPEPSPVPMVRTTPAKS